MTMPGPRSWQWALMLVAACSTQSSQQAESAIGDATPTCSIRTSYLPADNAVGDYRASATVTQADNEQQLWSCRR